MENCNCIYSIDATFSHSLNCRLSFVVVISSAQLSLLHMTGGRGGCCVIILVPFVDIFHGYFNLYLLHIFGR